MSQDTTTLPVVALVSDLVFSTRIAHLARDLNLAIEVVRDPTGLEDRDGRVLIVDLGQRGALAAAAVWRGRTGRPVVGFVSHVDVETMSAARAAGLDYVLPRSQFVAELPKILGTL